MIRQTSAIGSAVCRACIVANRRPNTLFLLRVALKTYPQFLACLIGVFAWAFSTLSLLLDAEKNSWVGLTCYDLLACQTCQTRVDLTTCQTRVDLFGIDLLRGTDAEVFANHLEARVGAGEAWLLNHVSASIKFDWRCYMCQLHYDCNEDSVEQIAESALAANQASHYHFFCVGTGVRVCVQSLQSWSGIFANWCFIVGKGKKSCKIFGQERLERFLAPCVLTSWNQAANIF